LKTFKRDYARVSPRPDAASVLRQLAGWFEHYNTVHPHKALGYRSPREFREQFAVEETTENAVGAVRRSHESTMSADAGQGRSRRRRWRAAPDLTRAQPWTNRRNQSLFGYSGATTAVYKRHRTTTPFTAALTVLKGTSVIRHCTQRRHCESIRVLNAVERGISSRSSTRCSVTTLPQ
jgi:hypothetical protein